MWPLPTFQHTATRRWLGWVTWFQLSGSLFQHTATRRWLPILTPTLFNITCFNTQPPEGGWSSGRLSSLFQLKFQHTATRRWLGAGRSRYQINHEFQHTATRRWLVMSNKRGCCVIKFQHPATRRWLGVQQEQQCTCYTVSTHSHPKVAGAAD